MDEKMVGRDTGDEIEIDLQRLLNSGSRSEISLCTVLLLIPKYAAAPRTVLLFSVMYAPSVTHRSLAFSNNSFLKRNF